MNKKRFAISLIAILVVTILCRGLLWRLISSYEDIKQLPLQTLTDIRLKDKIRTETKGMDGEEITSYCRRLTADCLSFSFKGAEGNVNKMFPKNKAHCVGYAAFFAAICEYAFDVNGIDGKCKHTRGWIHICGVNVHAPFSNVGSLKDHDYVNVSLSGKTLAVDPSIEDFFELY